MNIIQTKNSVKGNFFLNSTVELLVLLALVVAYPYVICQLVTLPSLTIIYGGVSLLLLLVIAWVGVKKMPKQVTLCLVIQIVYFGLSIITHQDYGYIEPFSFAIIAYILVAALQSTGGLKEYYTKYNIIVCLMAICGLLAFIGVFFNYIEPLLTFENRDERPAWCFGLTCTNNYYGNIIRSAGYFDEPGSLAQWGMFSLLINKLFIKNKFIELALIIGLISTFSLAYFIQLFVYVLFFFRNRNVSYWFMSLLLIIIMLSFYKTQGTQSDLFSVTYGRMDELFEGKSNRTGVNLENAKKFFAEEPLLGVGPTKMRTVYAADNPYESLASDGIIGTIFLYLPLMLVFKYRKQKEYYYAVIILLIGYLQRPFHFQVIHFFMIYSFLTLCCYEKRQRTQSISYNS